MDNRGEIIVGVVCVITLILFGISIYLMSIVNPEQLTTVRVPYLFRTAPGKPFTDINDDDDYEDNSHVTVDHVNATSTTASSNVTVNVNSTSTTTSNPVFTRKGRRSIIDRAASRHLSGDVILQVLDENKQSRVEIVLRSKSREEINNQQNNNIKSSDPTNKSNAAVRVVVDLNQNDLIQIVSDDIVVVDNILNSILKESRGGYNMEVLQYTKTDDNYFKNEKLTEPGPENNIYTTISEKMYNVGEPTETFVYPASVPFTQNAANFHRNIAHEKKSFIEHNVTSNNKEGTAVVRLPVNETVYINNTSNVHNHSSISVTMNNTTEKGDLVYTVKVPSPTSEVINTEGTLHEGNYSNKTSNTEYTVVKDNHGTASIAMQNTMNLSSDTVNDTEDTTSKENLYNESFIAEDILDLSNPTSNIFMNDNAYLEDSLTELNPASETIKIEHIVNISNDTSELVDIEETLNNSKLATENIDKEDVVIVTTPTKPINIEYTFNESIPTTKVIVNLENTIADRD